jgi:ferritin-like metal-binding protein YciE
VNALGRKDAARLLEQTLTEEERTDKALSALADTVVNMKAGA